MKKMLKKAARSSWKVLPRGVRSGLRNGFAELAGTREIRDSFRHIYGDYTIYEQLLKDKSDVTEYHVDKIIRSVGKQITDLQRENQDLKKRVTSLESARKKPL